jgi:hypothetical protein
LCKNKLTDITILNLSMIISLFLDRNNIGDVGVKYLSKRNWSNLTKLDLSAKLNYD